MGKQALRSIVIALAILVSLSVALGDCYLTVLHFNDFHGYLQPKEKGDGSVGGIARIATLADETREWNDAHGVTTLLLEAGDILQGTPLSTVYQGEPDVKCLNEMGLDAMCIGNHEFDFGQDNFQKLAALAKFPILAANIYVEKTGQRLVAPFAFFDLADGTKAAAFGLTTPETVVQTSPKNVADLRFTDPFAEAKAVVAELLKQTGFVIAVTHLGHEEDLKLAAAVPDIDLIIGGHSHTKVEPPVRVGKTIVCQAESYGLYLGQVDMFVSHGDVAKFRGFLRPVNEKVAAEPRVQALVDSYADKLNERFSEVVAHTTVPLDGEREHVRSQETNLGNLIADVVRDYAKTDVAIWNGGGIRAPIAAGPITVGDILTVLPFNNMIATKQVTGEQLRKVLEFNASQPRPFGGFLQVSGLTMEIAGDKLGQVTVGGQPLDPKRTYMLATAEFLLDGGDGYAMLTTGAKPVYLGYTDSMLVLEALRAAGTVSPAVEGRIIMK